METKNQAWVQKGLGKQLLQKMGWKEGEGLGAEGQGRTNNVSVRKVVEQRGLGFSNKESEPATVQQIQGLTDVLASLKNEAVSPEPVQDVDKSRTKVSKKRRAAKESKVVDDDAESVASSEAKPHKTKRRRGYQKFLRAKDISLYPKDDLKAILGGL